MRIKIMLALCVPILALLNYGIYEKEQIKKHGETLLLELAPVDPRSLMQGDYMRLRYAIERAPTNSKIALQPKRGYMVVRKGKNNVVAEFIDFFEGQDLKENEQLLHFHKDRSRLRIVPDTFFFQEGHGDYYENAKYGVFKVNSAGKHLLVGLADENRKTITPPE